MTWHGTANRCKEKSTATVTCFTFLTPATITAIRS
eukprot:CAMPEP_0177723248 /NCGR_PEP_ID=MMETSP0484_2-20121128/18113_1 /TAXON_ID=354590 /ORGANISM="Rhodomonas lens, Strain RHODO" /LENGTH=34 /DNA_ID= /DNA_START= /DNA_END= /DNA_ORIENTATION=